MGCTQCSMPNQSFPLLCTIPPSAMHLPPGNYSMSSCNVIIIGRVCRSYVNSARGCEWSRLLGTAMSRCAATWLTWWHLRAGMWASTG